jgi:hypothetical protein
MAIGYTRCSAQHKYDFDMQLSAADMAESSLPNQRHAKRYFETHAILSDEHHARREICYATADFPAAGRIHSSGRLPQWKCCHRPWLRNVVENALYDLNRRPIEIGNAGHMGRDRPEDHVHLNMRLKPRA